MPLAAVYDGTRILAHEMSQPEWIELQAVYKKSHLVMSCGEAAVPKFSPLKNQFFAHKAKVKCLRHEGGPESAQHLAAKARIAAAAEEAGWQSTIEYPSADRTWIADVLVEKDSQRIAMEVQWSAQSSADFTRRQERYTAAGVTCLWFVHRRNKEAAEAAKVPHFVFSDKESIDRVKARKAFGAMLDVALEDVVRRALTGGYKRRIEVRERQLIIGYYEDICSLCMKSSTVYRLLGVSITTTCGKQGVLRGGSFIPYPRVRIESQLMASIEKALANVAAPLAPLWMRTSKRAGQNYLAYNCAHCRGFFGSFYIAQQHYYDWDETLAPDDAAVRLNVRSLEHEHLCDDVGNGNCSRTTEEHPNYLCWWDQHGEVRVGSPARVRTEPADVVEAKPIEPLISFEPPSPPPSFDEQVRLRFAELDGSSRPERRAGPAPQMITVAEMTQEELRTALYNAYRALDDGYVRKKSAARQAAGMYDDLPELLGEDYPSR